MSIEIERIESVASHILHYRFAGNITAGDLVALAANERFLFSHVDESECFSVIADWSQIETIAAHLFPQLQQMRLIRDKKIRRVLVVGANPYLRALAISLGVVAWNNRVTFHATLDDALHMVSDEYANSRSC